MSLKLVIGAFIESKVRFPQLENLKSLYTDYFTPFVLKHSERSLSRPFFCTQNMI